MSVIKTINTQVNGRTYTINYELYDSSIECIEDCKKRSVKTGYKDMRREILSEGFNGVRSYNEALELMRGGWNKPVDEMSETVRKCKTVTSKRISFENEIQGFAPIVPLAILGVPNAMINTRIKPIKTKVISIYYDTAVSGMTSRETVLENGKKLIAAIIRLENSGYRVNLMLMDSYSDSSSSDILLIKIKSANQPLDLKRICFPLMHAAMNRVISFDWYSKFPKGTYRDGYGGALSDKIGVKDTCNLFKKVFGREAVFITSVGIKDKDYKQIADMLKGEKQ